MKRTTVFIDEALLRRARGYARRQGKSFAQAVREALAEYVARQQGTAGRLPSITGAFASGRSDIAERHEELLWRNPHS
ncbi:MAG: type II toxin-antitoxin system VapB family antitoxin [Gemmatimonadetes bacterium]|nr:type II toxin-antitoxin system VapB family antitoxin [Gemmatimonadota bacterium]